MTWLMICDTCQTPIRDHTTVVEGATVTGRALHWHPDCKETT